LRGEIAREEHQHRRVARPRFHRRHGGRVARVTRLRYRRVYGPSPKPSARPMSDQSSGSATR
jgi:hypothetical protein